MERKDEPEVIESIGDHNNINAGQNYEFRSTYFKLRTLIHEDGVAVIERMRTEDLILVARFAHEPVYPPVYPSACISWAEKEAVPLLHELSKRLWELQTVIETAIKKGVENATSDRLGSIVTDGEGREITRE